MAHIRCEFLYDRFAVYIEDRRREPRPDVLGGLAAATFPDGSLPEVIDVVRIAANVFSAGQETTVRLLSSALKVLAEEPELQRLLRRERDRIPNFIEETLRIESPIKGDFRLSRVPVTIGGVDVPAGSTLMLHERRGQPRSAPLRGARRPSTSRGRMPVTTSLSDAACTPAPARRWPAPKRARRIERLLDRTTDIRIAESVHGPAGARTLQVPADLHPARGFGAAPGVHGSGAARCEGPMRSVDDDRCAGHGVCTTMCPEVFALNDDGYAVAAIL